VKRCCYQMWQIWNTRTALYGYGYRTDWLINKIGQLLIVQNRTNRKMQIIYL